MTAVVCEPHSGYELNTSQSALTHSSYNLQTQTRYTFVATHAYQYDELNQRVFHLLSGYDVPSNAYHSMRVPMALSAAHAQSASP